MTFRGAALGCAGITGGMALLAGLSYLANGTSQVGYTWHNECDETVQLSGSFGEIVIPARRDHAMTATRAMREEPIRVRKGNVVVQTTLDRAGARQGRPPELPCLLLRRIR